MDAQASLAEARRAWRAKREAESQLARLARYARLTPGMKASCTLARTQVVSSVAPCTAPQIAARPGR